MQLIQALRLDYLPRLALVGSGGKTTAMFRIGRELLTDRTSQSRKPLGQGVPAFTVLLAATTHLATEQLDWADLHIVLESIDDFARLQSDLPEGLVLLTGSQEGEARVAGLSIPLMDVLRSFADERQLPLLVEADGSRQRLLKAPAEHEPVIPAWVDTVVVVCGLTGLGEPLNSEWVHRPERFADLAGLSLGEPVTPEALARMLMNPLGGLKGIPPEARRLALLNQAETPERQAIAHWLAEKLLAAYHSVVIAALASSSAAGTECSSQSREDRSDLPSLQQYATDESGFVYAVHEPVAGIILAAGSSSRMGQVKQVLPWRGEPLVRHVARTALAAGLSPVIIVAGSSVADVESAVQGLPISILYNSNWRNGQSTSVIAGMCVLPPKTGAVVFLLADQPQVPVRLVRGLVETHAFTLSPIVAPQVRGQRANPVLFDRQTFPGLLSLTGDAGGRVLFSQYPVYWLDWHDDSITLDVDTLEDYRRLLEIQ